MSIDPNIKLSEFLLIVAQDVERVSKDPKYTFWMERWHTPDNGVCKVCLAGAFLTNFVDEEELIWHPNEVFENPRIARMVSSLDDFRCANFDDFLRANDNHTEALTHALHDNTSDTSYNYGLSEEEIQNLIEDVKSASLVLKEYGL